MRKPLRTAVVSAGLIASSIALALAQTTPPQPPSTPSPGTPAQPPMRSQQPDWRNPQGEAIRASKLIGTSVRNKAGETIGDVNDVVLGKDGRVEAVVLGVGGFLGIGERQVAVGFDSLQLNRDNAGKMIPTIDATKEALKTAPEWRWSADERSSPTGSTTKPSR